MKSIYSIEINGIDGQPLDLNQFKGKFMLIVNVASECGFTGQYKPLQELYETYGEHLTVIGVPCNQFGGQEPGSAETIQGFCERRYGVEFPLTEKIKVRGEEQHPLYQWLTRKALNGKKSSSVKWNFQKYLISPEGELIDWFMTMTKPNSNKITKYFSRSNELV